MQWAALRCTAVAVWADWFAAWASRYTMRPPTPPHPTPCCMAPCRHRSLALVSRRFWQLLCAPQLLHTLDVIISGSNDEQAMPRLRSLAHFIIQSAAGSVRRLQLGLVSCGGTDETAPECLALLAAAAAACSGLHELELECRPTVTLSSWLLPLASSLRRLRTEGETQTVVAGSLEFLTALQDLELALLSGGPVIQPGARLPASLTRLALGGLPHLAPRMPWQVCQLPGQCYGRQPPLAYALLQTDVLWIEPSAVLAQQCIFNKLVCPSPHPARRLPPCPSCATCTSATRTKTPAATRHSPGCRCTRWS